MIDDYDTPPVYVTLRNGAVENQTVVDSIWNQVKVLSAATVAELQAKANNPTYTSPQWLAAIPELAGRALLQANGLLHPSVINVAQSCLVDGVVIYPVVSVRGRAS